MRPSSLHRFVLAWLIIFGSALSALAERELHVVGIYEGVSGGPSALVYLNRPGQSVTLLLSSYDSVDWHVTAGAGTIVERVFLTGYYSQTVSGLPAGVPVTRTSYEEGTGYILVGYSIDSSRFLRAVPKIAALTGQEISSFTGGYQPPAAGFTIDSVQNDPRLSSTYPQPVPAAELPDVQFDLATYQDNLTIRHYDLQGADDGGPLINSGPVMDADASSGFYYGGDDGFLEVNAKTGATRVIPPLEEITREGWQMGTTFDRKRNRALLVTLSGEGFLYGYSPLLNQWNLRVSMQNRDFDCIVYHDADDSLYTVTLSHEDSYSAKVVKLTAEGAFVKFIPLPIFPFDIESGGERAELVSDGEYLILLLAPGQYPHSDTFPESRIYLIDPRTSEIWLTYRQIGLPNKPPSVTLERPSSGTVVAPGTTVHFAANATDLDGTIASVEFFVDSQSIGFGTRAATSGPFVVDWTAPDSGSHLVFAKATDNKGATGLSAPLTMVVDLPPSITITAPVSGSTVQIGDNVTLTARAQDSDGSISSVVFNSNGPTLGTGLRVPGTDNYTLSWPATASGTFTIRASATDNLGAITQAASIQIIVSGPTDGTVKATRMLPRIYIPGRKLTVVITARPSSDVSSYTVIDHPPAGWTVNAINSGGRFDPVSGTVTFGPFSGSRPRTLIYRTTPPSAATGPQVFAGSVNVSGVESAITGDAVIDTVRVKVRPTLPPVLRNPYE